MSVNFEDLSPDVPMRVVQDFFPNATKNVQGTGIRGTNGDTFMFFNYVTDPNSASNSSTLRTQKIASYSGGTRGVVKTGTWNLYHVANGPTDYHWAGLDELINEASAGENVARYSKATKMSQGPTWAGCFEIADASYAGAPAIGIEVTARGNGADPSRQRNGVNVAAHRYTSAGGQDLEWGRGFWTSAADTNCRFGTAFENTAKVAEAVFCNKGADGLANGSSSLLKDTGALGRGIDLSEAYYSSGEAIRLGNNQRISLEPTGSRYIRSVSGVIEVNGAPLQVNNSLSFPSANLVSSSSGGLGGYLTIRIDGVTKKIPFYNA